MAVQVLIPISYGIEVQRENDPYGELAELSVLTLQNVLTPGAYLVVRMAPVLFPLQSHCSRTHSQSLNMFPTGFLARPGNEKQLEHPI